MRLERWMSVLRRRIRSLFFRRTVDQELGDELACHVDRLVEHYTAGGMTLAEARRKAFAAMDGVQHVHGSVLLLPGEPEPRTENIPLVLHNAVLRGLFPRDADSAGARAVLRSYRRERFPTGCGDR